MPRERPVGQPNHSIKAAEKGGRRTRRDDYTLLGHLNGVLVLIMLRDAGAEGIYAQRTRVPNPVRLEKLGGDLEHLLGCTR